MTLPLPLTKPLTLPEALHLAGAVTGHEPQQATDRLLLASVLCAVSTDTLNWTGALDALMTGRQVLTLLISHPNPALRDCADTLQAFGPQALTTLNIRVAGHLRQALRAGDWYDPHLPAWPDVTTFGDAYAFAAQLMPVEPSPHLPDHGAVSVHLLASLILAVNLEPSSHARNAPDQVFHFALRGSETIKGFLSLHPNWHDLNARTLFDLPASVIASAAALIMSTLARQFYVAEPRPAPHASLPSSMHSAPQATGQ